MVTLPTNNWPIPTIIICHQNIAYYINQFSIYTLNKIEQEEETQTLYKKMLFKPGFEIDILG
jgi:hypothetical protein